MFFFFLKKKKKQGSFSAEFLGYITYLDFEPHVA